MESDLNSGIILDFFGFPGSGKTTIANLVSMKLKKQGYIVNDDVISIGNKSSKVLRLLTKFKSTLIFSSLHFNFMVKLFKSLGDSPFISLNEAVKQWVNICHIMIEYKKSSSKYDYKIFDQGLVQAAVSLTVNCDSKKTEFILFELLKMANIRPYFIYIQASKNIVLKRQKERKNGRSRVEIYTNNNNEKIKMLKKIEESYEQVIKCNTDYMRYVNDEKMSLEELSQMIFNDLIK